MSITVYRHLRDIPSDCFLADCAVSGGTLEDFLRKALELSEGKLCLRLQKTAMDFLLPCPSGIGAPVSTAELEQLREKYPCHFSPALMTDYLTHIEVGQLHLTLFDTEETIAKKLKLAETLGVPMAFYPESSNP